MMPEKRYPQTVLASAMIPWTENYEFDEKIFRRQVKGIADKGIHHIYTFGTAGEGYAVTDRQYEAVIKAFADEMKAPGLFPMAGVISLSLATMIERVKIAVGYGIKDIMITMPSWGALNDVEMNRFFHDICDPFPGCRFVYYNLLRTKRLISVKEFEALSAEIPNLAGVKFCSNDALTIREIATTTCPLQFFVAEPALYIGNIMGQCSLLITIGNIHIKKTLAYYEAAVQGDLATAAKLFAELMKIHQGLFDICKETKIDGAYDQLFSKLMDPEFPLRLLPPYTSFSEEVFERFRNFLKTDYPEWVETPRG